MVIRVEQTGDGSPTLYREDIDEHYHSVKGAMAESRHVYLHMGWEKASQSFETIRVFEVGFGTGLNAALTACKALDKQVKTEYYSVDLYPLSRELTDTLLPTIDDKLRREFMAVNESIWEDWVEINPYFRLKKLKKNLLEMEIPAGLNCVYFDAFAPEKQAEMWDSCIFRRLYDCLEPGGVLTTYCAKGSIRRMLKEIGFATERLPGPPDGKREILRATRKN